MRLGILIGIVSLFVPMIGQAATVYLNKDNISVSVGSNTGPGSSNNTFSGGQTIEKVIDAPAADAVDDHNQTTHIWYSFPDPSDGLELIFDFGVSYDIATLHFWNYFGESFDVDQVDFSFFNSLGDLIGTETILPPLGSSTGNLATDIALVSPLNTRTVSAFLTGTNGQVDFQNIGFTAAASDPNLDPEAPMSAVPLPATGLMMLSLLGLISAGGRRFGSRA
ncbi:MAG: PEP-CTERM sorting domain-containing protein [Pseudomonadota bacterium]